MIKISYRQNEGIPTHANCQGFNGQCEEEGDTFVEDFVEASTCLEGR